MRSSSVYLSLAGCLALSGCVLGDLEDLGGADDSSDIDAVGETSLELLATNGRSLNGTSLNGTALNGRSLNGRSLNGTSLGGMTLNGTSLSGMTLNGSQLQGLKSGQAISGTGLVGATMNATASDDGPLTLRIDSATTLPAPNSDVWAYGVSYALSGGSWAPLCGSSSILAVPVAGTWNYGSGVTGGGSWMSSSTAFTFGCRGTAIAKCVELGYKPWKTVSGVLLRDHHQACTRMIRADYCGDGTPWTTDGTLINIYDDLGIQTDATGDKIDAEWLTTGARCIHELRDFQAGKPTCEATKKQKGCGTFANGALLINEYKS